jgi:Tol biopolymer transport system component
MSGAATDAQAIGPLTGDESADRLDSWKEIAAYLRRGVTTVQRWEREEHLPVHRHQHDALGSVYAFKHELEAWRVARASRSEAEARNGEAAAVSAWKLPPRWKSAAAAALALLAAAGVGAIVSRATAPERANPIRRLTSVSSGATALVTHGIDRNLAITPDGSRIVYVGGLGAPRLFVRPLDQLEATPIPGVVSARYPFVSPDGQWIGFFEGYTSLKKVPVTGGPVTEVVYVNAGGEAGPRGATWGADNRIAFAVGDRLLRVSAEGGEPELLAVADHARGEAAYWWPEYLRNGRGLLFTIVPSGDWSEKGTKGSIENAKVAVLDLRSGERKVLIDGGSHARYLSSGHLVYAAEGTLRAVRFDLGGLAVAGSYKTVLPEVAVSRMGAANFDVAQDGTLVYAPGEVENDLVTLLWASRSGMESPVGTPAFSYRYPRLSPDGSRVAMGSPRDLGMWDFASGRLTWFGIGPTTYPTWTPDGRRIVFASTRAGAANIYLQVIDGSTPFARLTDSPFNQFPNTISPDGRYLVFRQDTTSSDLMVLDLEGERPPEPLIQTAAASELNADFSPDGRFLTYQSNETGQDEIYVQPFPNVSGQRWKVSTGGGRRPKWARNGDELFYFSTTEALMSVNIQRRATAVTVGAMTMVLEGRSYFAGAGRTYDVAPDGNRFLMMKPVNPSPTSSGKNVEVVLNWFTELTRLVPMP